MGATYSYITRYTRYTPHSGIRLTLTLNPFNEMNINHVNKQDIRHTIVSHAGQDAWPGWAMPVVYHGTLFLLFLVAWAGAGCFAKVR